MRLRAAAAIALLGVAGCATFTPVSRVSLHDDVPAAWDARAEAGRLSFDELWWKHFEDAALEALMNEALENNWDLRIAAARLESAEARARIAGADRKPQAAAGLDSSRRRQNFLGFPIPGGGEEVLSSTNTTLGLSLNLSWEVDLWGRIRSGALAAGAEADAARADLEAAALSVTGQIAKTYYAVVEAREQLAIAERTVSNRSRTREQVQRRYEAGLRSALDLRLARTNEALAQGSVETRQQVVDELERQLSVLVGRYPRRSLEGKTRLPAPPPTVPAGLPSELVTRRPDLAATERRLEAAGHRVGEARAALYPRLTLTGSAGRSSEELDDLLDGDFSVWSLAAGLLQPLFQGGRLRAAVDLAEATFDEAVAVYAADVLGAFREVETALAADRILADRVGALDAAVRHARAAQELAEDRYRAGLVEFLNVLDTQRQTFQAESLLAEAKRRRLDARVDLILALGGGYENDAAGQALARR